MNQKRGQITLFVILGIIALLMTSIGFWFYEQRMTVQQRNIPDDIQQVVTFVENCLQEYGTRAVRILGQQGGYIQLPRKIDQNPWAYIEKLPDSGIKEPFWYYEGENLYPENRKLFNICPRILVDLSWKLDIAALLAKYPYSSCAVFLQAIFDKCNDLLYVIWYITLLHCHPLLIKPEAYASHQQCNYS